MSTSATQGGHNNQSYILLYHNMNRLKFVLHMSDNIKTKYKVSQ